MLRVVATVLRYLLPVHPPIVELKPAFQFAGQAPDRQHWFRKKGVLWFNGFPGVPKLPLVQRPRSASPLSSLNAVASLTPEEKECLDEETLELL